MLRRQMAAPTTDAIAKEVARMRLAWTIAEPWKNSDATLIVEERKFHVHQTLLTLSSPFFEALFSDTNFAEGTVLITRWKMRHRRQCLSTGQSRSAERAAAALASSL